VVEDNGWLGGKNTIYTKANYKRLVISFSLLLATKSFHNPLLTLCRMALIE
jgi:hypothetical protein